MPAFSCVPADVAVSPSAAQEGQCVLVHTMHVQPFFLLMTSLPTLMSRTPVELCVFAVFKVHLKQRTVFIFLSKDLLYYAN